MLLDDRRIVLTLEAICWCTAAMVFFQQTDFPSAIAILPLLMAVLIHVEYPPAGSGVGTVAEAAPGLTFEEDHAKHAAEVFDKEGGLLRGHFGLYVPYVAWLLGHVQGLGGVGWVCMIYQFVGWGLP